MQCKTCRGPLSGKQRSFCSRECKNADTNRKHNTYQSQKLRAVLRKIAFVLSKGGKCEHCGYNRNLAALQFHHTDPSQKELRLDRRIMSNYNMARLIEEVAKCRLLCANCHAEEHHPDESNWCVRQESNLQHLG